MINADSAPIATTKAAPESRDVLSNSIVDLVRGALAFRAASLVIFRDRTLIEFKTEKLGGGLQLYEEDGHRSWQIGDFDDHHCHLDVTSCSEVNFGAEPVSCQGGRLNFTVWFNVAKACGNPYRPNAYFSVTLNKPYADDGTLKEGLVEQYFELYRRFAHVDGVTADDTFLHLFEDPARLAAA